MKKTIKYAGILLFVFCVFYYDKYLFDVQENISFTNNIMLIPLAAVLFRTADISLKMDRKFYKYVAPLGIFYSYALIFGTQLSRTQEIDFRSGEMWAAGIVYALMWTVVLGRAFHLLNSYLPQEMDHQSMLCKIASWKYFRWFCMVFMLLAWIPVWLASYPGFFCYDVGTQYTSIVNGVIDRHHPVIHTWLIGLFLSVSERLTRSANPGIALLTVCQLLFLAAVFSYALQYMKRCNARPGVLFGGLLIYSFLPTIQIYVSCTAKDLIYSGLLLLMILKMIQLWREDDVYWKTWKHRIDFGVVLFLAMAFRNNAIYIVCFFAMLALALLKRRRKLFFTMVGITVFLYLVYNGPFMDAMGIGGGSVQEMLSVPIQQLGRVYIKETDTYDEDDLELLFETIPKEWWDCYQPKCADAVKGGMDKDAFQKNKGKLLRLWIETGIKKPGIYLDAFFLLTVDSWCPNSVLDGYVGYLYPRETIQSSYFVAQVEIPGEKDSKIQELYNRIVDIGYRISFQKIPLISMLFSVGAMLWFYLFALVYAIYQKKRYFWAPLLLVGISYGTHLFGPMVLVRYHLILFFVVPLCIWILFDGKKPADGMIQSVSTKCENE